MSHFHIDPSAFSLFGYYIQHIMGSCHFTAWQQTSQLFHRPSVITVLYCTLLSSSQTHFMIRLATLLFLKGY